MGYYSPFLLKQPFSNLHIHESEFILVYRFIKPNLFYCIRIPSNESHKDRWQMIDRQKKIKILNIRNQMFKSQSVSILSLMNFIILIYFYF